ncbi:unnamed protein product, partial [Didymodactylos carnosus]
RPSAPYQPIISQTSINSTTLVLNWRKDSDFNYSPIRYSIIQYEIADKWYNYKEKPEGQITSLLIKGLEPNSKYRFRLAAQNDIGISDYSRPTNFITTKEALPSLKLEIDEINREHPCQINLHIKQFNSHRSDAMQLKILYKQLSSETFETVLFPITNTSIHMSNICSSSVVVQSVYILFICLTNSVGDGPLSHAKYFHLNQYSPNKTVELVSAQPISSNQINLEWTRVNDINGYQIQWFENETSNEIVRKRRNIMNNTIIVSNHESSTLLENLKPYTIYDIYVTTFNVFGNGPVNMVNRVRTHEAPPSFITKLIFSYVTYTSLDLSWSEPSDRNGLLRTFELVYSSLPNTENNNNNSSTLIKTIKQVITYPTMSLKIDDLESRQLYDFQICACTIVCGPVVKQTIRTGPQPNSPTFPSDFTFSNEKNELIWKPVTNSEYYLLEYASVTTDENKWNKLDKTTKSLYHIDYTQLFPQASNDTYTFRVYSMNHYGISEASSILRITSTELLPRSASSPSSIIATVKTFIT